MAQLNIVISGCFNEQAIGHFGRNDVKAMILNAGHKVQSDISSKTDYLVIGTAVAGRPPGPSKIKKAQELDVKVITLDELYSILDAA